MLIIKTKLFPPANRTGVINGSMNFARPLAETGDHIDFLAEMDVLVAASACPDDRSAMNDHSCKAIRVQILEAQQ